MLWFWLCRLSSVQNILIQSCASSPDSFLSYKSFLMLLLYQPPPLQSSPASPSPTLLATYSSSLLSTCPCHFNPLSCTFLDIFPTFVVPLILSLLILSSLVTPLIRLILISVTSNFFSCDFFTIHVSALHTGLTAVLLHTFPFTLKLILLVTGYIFKHFV